MRKILTLENERLFEESLRSSDAIGALSTTIRRLLKEQGRPRQEILAELEEFRGVLREQGRDTDEDVVLEVMDFLVGWSSPHMSMMSETPETGGDGEQEGNPASSPPRHVVPRPQIRVVALGTGRGVWTDRHEAARWRDLYFPPTAVERPTIAILDLTGVFPTPGVLQDFILPIAQGVRGGVYGPLMLVVRTHDDGVADFLSYLAKQYGLSIFTISSAEPSSGVQAVGNLTSTDQTTLHLMVQLGGTVTASELARTVGIEPTAAGNRLVNLFKKGFLFRVAQPRREGDVFVEPRVYLDPISVGSIG
jgi:hypothetical protein